MVIVNSSRKADLAYGKLILIVLAIILLFFIIMVITGSTGFMGKMLPKLFTIGR